eukprot:772229-Rhodomonas_salina.1
MYTQVVRLVVWDDMTWLRLSDTLQTKSALRAEAPDSGARTAGACACACACKRSKPSKLFFSGGHRPREGGALAVDVAAGAWSGSLVRSRSGITTHRPDKLNEQHHSHANMGS